MMTSERQEFVGGYVTPKVKHALMEEAVNLNTSVSNLLFEILIKWLDKRGHELKDELVHSTRTKS
jgi:hypothetical protein